MRGEKSVILYKIVIPNDKVREMSKSYKRQYLMMTNMLRDLNLLQKLLLFVRNNANKDEATISANTTISFFFLKTLISKNYEMLEFMENENLLTERFGEQLDSLRKQIEEFFSVEKNRGIFKFIRNKFGFHYESDPEYKEELENLIAPAMDNHEMDMWLSDTDSGNEIFGSSNAIMLKVIFEKMRNDGFVGDDAALMSQLFDLTLKVSGIFHDFYKLYLVEEILEGITIQDQDIKKVKIRAPLLSQTKLPLIVKLDVKKGKDMPKKCKKCKVPLEGFMYKWIAFKIFKIKPSEKDLGLCNKCDGTSK